VTVGRTYIFSMIFENVLLSSSCFPNAYFPTKSKCEAGHSADAAALQLNKKNIKMTNIFIRLLLIINKKE
jgi:hypothetical protein